MTVRRQERKVEDELLKRELLLRLRSEYYATPVRTRPATDDFRRRVRRLLLRHPLFAFKYYRLSSDPGLGRFEDSDPDCRGDRESRASAGLGYALLVRLQRTFKSTSRPPAGASIASALPGEGGIMSRMACMHADDPHAPFLFDFDATYTAEGWSARIAWRAFAYETEPDEDTERSGIENPTGRVLAHMVGDDREYAFEPDDLAPRKRARWVAEGRRQWLILFACVGRFGSRARTLAGRVVVPLQAKELRLGRSDRSRTVASAPRPPRRHRHARATAGVLAGVALIAGAAAAVVERHHFRSNGRATATASAKSQPALRLPARWWQPPRGAPNHPRAPKRVERRPAKTTRRAKPRPARQTILVSNTVPTVSSATAAASKPDAAVTTHNDGPGPLRAPPGDTAPGPLKAP